jgi:hypothetical protein
MLSVVCPAPFRIATAEERALDEAEGVGHGYRKDEITVLTLEGTFAAMAYSRRTSNGGVTPTNPGAASGLGPGRVASVGSSPSRLSDFPKAL